MISFRQRLVLGHLLAIVAVLAVAGMAAHWGLSRAVHQQLDAALLAVAETELGLLPTEPGEPVRIHELPSKAAALSFVRLDRLVQIIRPNGSIAARSVNLAEAQLPVPAALLARLAAGETVFETLEGYGEEPVRMVSVPTPVAQRGRLLAVQVAGSLDDVNQVVDAASELFIAMAVALIGVVGAAGAVLTREAFRAIDRLVLEARGIGEGNLHRRLPHPGTRDEIGRLVDTLNAMLGRLEQSLEMQRRFTADASHELRSPLSRLRTELELALRRPREPAVYVETLRSCLEEVERLTLMVEELLALARIDAGQERGPVEVVSLNQLVEETMRRAEPMARDRGVRLVLLPSSAVTVRVGRGPASLVLANLIDNALKFSPSGGQVTVSLGAEGPHAVLTVADTGPGIDASDLPHLFERFYRGIAVRDGSIAGVGLGLALSRAVVASHGGLIDAVNAPEGGARFTLRLPLAA